MNITLYQCAEDVRAVLDAHFDSDSEAADTLEAVIGQFEVKAQSVIGYYKNIEAADAMLDAHIKQMQEKKKALSGRLKSLHEYLGRNMLAAGIKEIKAEDGSENTPESYRHCFIIPSLFLISTHRLIIGDKAVYDGGMAWHEFCYPIEKMAEKVRQIAANKEAFAIPEELAQTAKAHRELKTEINKKEKNERNEKCNRTTA